MVHKMKNRSKRGNPVLSAPRKHPSKSKGRGTAKRASLVKTSAVDGPQSTSFKTVKARVGNSKTIKRENVKKNKVVGKKASVSHKSWTKIEEVFLVGAVVDMFLSRGSLSPKHYGESCWQLIKQNYDTSWREYMRIIKTYKKGQASMATTLAYPFLKEAKHETVDNHMRTQGAMARHFKEMKDRCAKGTSRNFSYFLREWEETYNVNYCLLKPTENEKKASNTSNEEATKLDLSPAPEKSKRAAAYEGRWSHQDEVFLIATVVNRFLMTGSLASPRGSNDQACWSSIYENFIWLQQNASVDNPGVTRQKRSVSALLRRYKLIKEHQSTKNTIRGLYQDWKKHCGRLSSMVGPMNRSMNCSAGMPLMLAVQVNSNNNWLKLQQPDVQNPPNQNLSRASDGNMLHLLDQAVAIEMANREVLLNTSKRKAEATTNNPVKKQRSNDKGVDVEAGKVSATKGSSRTKWTPPDVACLWNGIRLYGNSWSEIQRRFLPKRSVDQVKDKGKRLLRRVGWSTGRTKGWFCKASEDAKAIGLLMCERGVIPTTGPRIVDAAGERQRQGLVSPTLPNETSAA